MLQLESSISPEQQNSNLIRFLVEARDAAKLSQSELGQVLGLSQPDISKIERFERRIDTVECLRWLLATSAVQGQNTEIVWQKLYALLMGRMS